MKTKSAVRVLTTILSDHSATYRFGEMLGAACETGDALALCGPLAAGKTTLAQGLARGLGVSAEQRVRSPTFALCNEYSGRISVLHADLYRMASAEEAEDLGFRERVGTEGVAIIEWADRFPEILPLHSLWLRLDHHGDQRRLSAWLTSEHRDAAHWAERLPALSSEVTWTEDTAPAPWEPVYS